MFENSMLETLQWALHAYGRGFGGYDTYRALYHVACRTHLIAEGKVPPPVVEKGDFYCSEQMRYMKVVYFPNIFPLRLPVAVPDVLFADQQQVGLATVRMGFSGKISVVALAILTSELESTEGTVPPQKSS